MTEEDEQRLAALTATQGGARTKVADLEAALAKARGAGKKDVEMDLIAARTSLDDAVAAIEAFNAALAGAKIDQPAVAHAAGTPAPGPQRVAGTEPGIGADLPSGMTDTSMEPGASMPDVGHGTTRVAAMEAIADAVLPPARSPVFPAGADPAGAIMEGQRDASVQSATPAAPTVGADYARAPYRTAFADLGLRDGEAVRISAKRDGFRRNGMAHSSRPVDHPAGRFSEAEIRDLESEPMLHVQRLGRDAGA